MENASTQGGILATNGLCIAVNEIVSSGEISSCALGLCLSDDGTHASCVRVSDYDYENIA